MGKLLVDLSVLTRPFATLSFGERTKIMLALVSQENNFLLIDEPTNHLDMEGEMYWLIICNLKTGSSLYPMIGISR